MRISKKSMGIVGLFIIFMNAINPIVRVKAGYNTSDFYLVDDNGNKMKQFDIMNSEEFDLNVIRENPIDSKIQIPEEILLNQESIAENEKYGL